MNDLMRELYEETILDHYKRPRNSGKLEDADHRAEGYNPFCGDVIHLFLKFENGKVAEVAYESQSCAICTASASLMSEAIKGKTEQELQTLFQAFTGMVKGEAVDLSGLGDLEILSGVKDHPVRIKCATLAWHTLLAALKSQDGGSVSTE